MKYCEKLIKWRKERATAIEQRLKTRHQHNESSSSSNNNNNNTGKSTSECVGPSYNTIEDGLPTKTKKLKGAICGHLTCPHGKLEAGGKKIFWVSRTVYNTMQKHFHSSGGSGGSGGSSSSAVPIVIEDEGGGKEEPLQDPVFLGEKLQHVCEECREGKQDSKKEKQAKKTKHKQQVLEEDEQGKLYNSKLQLCKNAVRWWLLVVGGGHECIVHLFFHFLSIFSYNHSTLEKETLRAKIKRQTTCHRTQTIFECTTHHTHHTDHTDHTHRRSTHLPTVTGQVSFCLA